jgi:hypothetical protein
MRRTISLAAVAALVGLALLVGRSTAAGSAQPVVVKLPKHVFGHFRSPDLRDVDARWGKRPGQVGLVHAEAGPIGGSSFDVVNSVVCVLDQVNSRVLVFDPRKSPRAIPLVVKGRPGSVFRGVDSSLAVGTDGTIYVLEPVDSIHHNPTLRSFPASGGAPLATTATGGSNPIVRASGKTAYVTQSLVGPWKAAMTAGRVTKGAFTPYRPYVDHSRVQVLPGTKQPIVVKLTRSDGEQLAWRVTSPDFIGVEDAESFGGIELMLVLSVNADKKKTEYEVVVLGPKGVLDSFSVPSDQYTTTAQNDDFRVDGSTLYHRGSTAKGLYVDEYQF